MEPLGHKDLGCLCLGETRRAEIGEQEVSPRTTGNGKAVAFSVEFRLWLCYANVFIYNVLADMQSLAVIPGDGTDYRRGENGVTLGISPGMIGVKSLFFGDDRGWGADRRDRT